MQHVISSIMMAACKWPSSVLDTGSLATAACIQQVSQFFLALALPVCPLTISIADVLTAESVTACGVVVMDPVVAMAELYAAISC